MQASTLLRLTLRQIQHIEQIINVAGQGLARASENRRS